MQEYIQFALKYWYLSGPFLILLIVVIFEEARSRGLTNQCTVQNLIRLMNYEGGVVVDLRDINAFKAGHIINSINLPETAVETNMEKINAYKTRPLILVCAQGTKASAVSARLRKQGFEKVHVLSGGIAAWQEAQMPLVKK